MHKVQSGSNLIDKKVKILKSKENLAIYVVREGEIKACTEDIFCQENDLIVAFCRQESEDLVEKWIHNL
jgi:Trk K+ transport system NAD-binding subunit